MNRPLLPPRWREALPLLQVAVCAGLAALSTYACMYAFRKPFAAAAYEGLAFAGMDLKVWLVIAQALGYMASKFIGIGVIGGLRRERRATLLLALVITAWLALLGFALVPAPWNIPFLFLNGLPLGMVWGVVFSYLEGRRGTEAMGAILASSFIFASGLVKAVGKWLLLQGVSDFWMPFLTGALFLLPLYLSLRWLERVPGPDGQDLAARGARSALDPAQRRALLARLWPGLVLAVICYIGLTAVRDFRDSFEAELFTALGHGGSAGVFLRLETPIALVVLLATASLSLVRDNLSGLLLTHLLMLAGLCLAGISTLAYQAGALAPLWWLGLAGLGLYLAYVPFNCVFYERVLATFRIAGNVGFLMYLADACGYLGSIAVLLARQAGAQAQSWPQFFADCVLVLAVVGGICLAWSALYFLHKARNDAIARQPWPA